MKAIVVLSGGMDSATALAWARNQKDIEVIGALSFWYGSKHNEAEFSAAVSIAGHYQQPITRISLPFINELFKSDLLESGGEIPTGHYADPSMKRTVVPFRNGIMLSIAAGYAESKGADAIIIGNHFGDHAIYPDCRAAFIQPMAKAVEEGTYARVKLISPFCEIDKTEIARIGVRFAVPYALTYSCYKGQPKHCGTCGTCFERKEAFRLAGVTDPTEYVE